MTKRTLKNTSVLPTSVQKEKELEAKKILLQKAKELEEKKKNAKKQEEQAVVKRTVKHKKKKHINLLNIIKKIVKSIKNAYSKNNLVLVTTIAAVSVIAVLICIVITNNKLESSANIIQERYTIRNATTINDITGVAEENWSFVSSENAKINNGNFDAIYYKKDFKSSIELKILKGKTLSSIKSNDDIIDYFTQKGYTVSSNDQRLNGFQMRIVSLKNVLGNEAYIYYIEYPNYLVYAVGEYNDYKDKNIAEKFITNLSLENETKNINISEYFGSSSPLSDTMIK